MTDPERSQSNFASDGSLAEHAAGRVAEALSLLTAIDMGELLSAAPSEPSERARHAAGVCLLAVLQRELTALGSDLQAAGA